VTITGTGAIYDWPEPAVSAGLTIGAELPLEFMALTEKIYDLPLIRPVIVAEVSVVIIGWLSDGKEDI
jgi:hypothetical protein